MFDKIRKALKIRQLRHDIRLLEFRPVALRKEANELQFEVLPQLQRELDALTGAPAKVKPVGLVEPASLQAYRNASHGCYDDTAPMTRADRAMLVIGMLASAGLVVCFIGWVLEAFYA